MASAHYPHLNSFLSLPSPEPGCSTCTSLQCFPIWELCPCSPLPRTFSTHTPHPHIITIIFLFPLRLHSKFTFSGRSSLATPSKITTPQLLTASHPPDTHAFSCFMLSPLLYNSITQAICFFYLSLLSYPLLGLKLHGDILIFSLLNA